MSTEARVSNILCHPPLYVISIFLTYETFLKGRNFFFILDEFQFRHHFEFIIDTYNFFNQKKRGCFNCEFCWETLASSRQDHPNRDQTASYCFCFFWKVINLSFCTTSLHGVHASGNLSKYFK